MSRAFIVGNGPSIKKMDMDLLIGETSFALNKIHLHYKKTEWRPTYYTCVDYTGEDPILIAKIHAELEEICFFRPEMASQIFDSIKYWSWPIKIHFIPLCSKHQGANHRSRNRAENWHLPLFCKFGSGINVLAQLAVTMGHNPLIFIGCDLGFKPVGEYEPDTNHFDPSYGTFDDFPIEERDPTLIYTHGIIQKECDEREIKVYDATLDGLLEVHEKITLEDALGGSYG